MISSCNFLWRREDGRMKIVNRPEIHVPQTNHVMDNMGVTVYKFALCLFGLQIYSIGLLQRIDYCRPSIGCMQPLVFIKISTSGIVFLALLARLLENGLVQTSG